MRGSDLDAVKQHLYDLLIRVTLPPEVMLPRFALYMLLTRAVRRQVEAVAKTAAGIWKINQGNIAALHIPCPPVDVQQSFVSRADDVRRSIAMVRESLASLSTEQLSSTILRKAFAGEL